MLPPDPEKNEPKVSALAGLIICCLIGLAIWSALVLLGLIP